jgi:hypothetical protein
VVDDPVPVRRRTPSGTGGDCGEDGWDASTKVGSVGRSTRRPWPAPERYAYFDHFSGNDPQVYGFAAAFGAGEQCEQAVVEQLVDLQRHAVEYAREEGLIADDEL